MTAYDTGSSGFNIAVAVGKAFKDKHNTDLRVLPAGNDVARLAPLKGGRAQASAMGIGVYFAQEGVFEFAVKDWGPQALRLILASTDCNAISLGVAKDTGVKEIKDLKGKRIGMVVGSPALNQNAFAVLAFAGLRQATSSWSSSPATARCGRASSTTRSTRRSPRPSPARPRRPRPRRAACIYPPVPAADKAGWARLNKIGPYYAPHKATCGVGLSAQNPVELPNYPYPIFTAYASQPADVVYGIAKSMIVNYAAYKDGAPGAAGLELKRQNLAWVLPYHEGDGEGASRKPASGSPSTRRTTRRRSSARRRWPPRGPRS